MPAIISNCCDDAISQTIAILAAKYGFDAEEALRELSLGHKCGQLIQRQSSNDRSKTYSMDVLTIFDLMMRILIVLDVWYETTFLVQALIFGEHFMRLWRQRSK